MIRRPPRSTLSSSSAASDVYKRQEYGEEPTERMLITRMLMLMGMVMEVTQAQAFTARCTLARGLSLDIRVNRKWAPLGAARFEELVRAGWLDRTPLYRAVPNFLVQFGLNASSSQRWGPISDDSKAHSPKHFARGMVSFAGSGPNSRDTEMFIAFAAVSSLGQAPWETPFGMVTRDTLHVLDQVNTEYGDMPPWGTGPNPSKIRSSPDYLANSYPNIDYWQECHVLATSTSDDTATDL
eukprot:TRINITY_DN10648_c0_g1_i2.p1 TRINITY_DN10648_c0_g1~~TRINITY_DN10648_c0_g1_i2.p1  ORF type:complete len:239 (-),score=38.59 TRINITY_DN10648_c0_g1_i2:332-1048(-)